MGPPPFGSGNSHTHIRLDRQLARFNGATAFRQWKRREPTERRDLFRGFNGATAFRQWKRGRRPWLLATSPGFNGATAFRQWKLGSLISTGHLTAWLQWGHRLSAVETATLTNLVVQINGLQWGHRLSAVETGNAPLSLAKGLLASMGPPPFGSGNRCTLRPLRPFARASMGPPPFGSGNSQLGGCPPDPMPASMGPPPFGSGNNTEDIKISGCTFEASMGPPPFGSGNKSQAQPKGWLSQELQWGHAYRQWKRARRCWWSG